MVIFPPDILIRFFANGEPANCYIKYINVGAKDYIFNHRVNNLLALSRTTSLAYC